MPREFMHFDCYRFALSLITWWVKLLGENGESLTQVKERRASESMTVPNSFLYCRRIIFCWHCNFLFRLPVRKKTKLRKFYLCFKELMTVNVHFRIKYNLLFFLPCSRRRYRNEYHSSPSLLNASNISSSTAVKPNKKWECRRKNGAASMDLHKHTLRTLPDKRTYTEYLGSVSSPLCVWN